MEGFVVGITGGVATGKTVLAGFLRRRGATYYSVDAAAHALYCPGFPAYRAILRGFGQKVLAADGTIDRTKLGALVFSSPAAMKRLERILHLRLRQEVRRAVRRLKRRTAYVVVEAGPLLFKLKLHTLMDLVVLVQCQRTIQLQRLRRSKGFSLRAARKRVNVFARLEASLPAAARKFRRALVVTSDGPVARLKAAAVMILARGAHAAS